MRGCIIAKVCYKIGTNAVYYMTIGCMGIGYVGSDDKKMEHLEMILRLVGGRIQQESASINKLHGSINI